MLASSSGSELSQESEQLRSSYFTHHLLVGLRGAGDANGDGQVSIDEAYRYAYHQTLLATAETAVGGQHVSLEGQTLVEDTRAHAVIAETYKAKGSPVRIAVPPGTYRVLVRHGGRLARCEVTATAGAALIDLARCRSEAISKHGPGRAVVASMRAAVVDTGCEDVTPLGGGPAPLGALCDTGADCASAICATASFFAVPRCAGCDPGGASCGAGETCRLTAPGPAERDVPLACIAAAAGELGEQCLRPAECASGLCTAGVCSACAPDQGCACTPAYDHGPSLCDAGLGHAAAGAACARNADCASQQCSGAPRQQCSDGRSCASDANCSVDAQLVPGPGTTVGVQGGRCD